MRSTRSPDHPPPQHHGRDRLAEGIERRDQIGQQQQHQQRKPDQAQRPRHLRQPQDVVGEAHSLGRRRLAGRYMRAAQYRIRPNCRCATSAHDPEHANEKQGKWPLWRPVPCTISVRGSPPWRARRKALLERLLDDASLTGRDRAAAAPASRHAACGAGRRQTPAPVPAGGERRAVRRRPRRRADRRLRARTGALLFAGA